MLQGWLEFAGLDNDGQPQKRGVDNAGLRLRHYQVLQFPVLQIQLFKILNTGIKVHIYNIYDRRSIANVWNMDPPLIKYSTTHHFPV